jgi:hypothetical protein
MAGSTKTSITTSPGGIEDRWPEHLCGRSAVKCPVRVDSLFGPLISGKETHAIRPNLLYALIHLVYGLDHLGVAWNFGQGTPWRAGLIGIAHQGQAPPGALRGR